MPNQTTAALLLDSLQQLGIEFLFANLGSDHPPLLEAIEQAREQGRALPRLITCPNEMVALSAAHGCALASGRPQAVVVHVECGTQALAGAVHNAARGRVPVLIFAGASPLTQEGELRGSRNEFIHWIQDVHDQHGIVRGYMKYDYEIRVGHNLPQVLARALRIACSAPQGPVYLSAAREVLEQEVPALEAAPLLARPLEPLALAPAMLEELADALCRARAPLIVTSHLGRRPEAVRALQRLSTRLAIPVCESAPSCLNLPSDDPMYLGNQWNQPVQNPLLAEADVVLVLDSDVPWIPTVNRPRPDARIFHIDVDALKQAMPLWYIGAERSAQADALCALRQLDAELDRRALPGQAIEQRRARIAELHARRDAELARLEARPADGCITPEYLSACLRRHVDAETVVCNEGISNYHTVINHLRLSEPGSLLASGGGSLGWSGGAALGVRLMRPGSRVVVMCGDGSYLFSVPSSVHWMARRYATPFLTVIFNNGGWKSPKLSALALHAGDAVGRSEDLGVSFAPAPDHAGIATAAGGAWGRRISRADEVEPALREAFAALDEGRAAVLDVQVGEL